MVSTITTEVSQAPVYYWAEGGLYGPFDIQQEGHWAGWPNFGQVLRYFRKKAKLSARAFGELYGKTVNADKSVIGEGWIYDMETENMVPVDIGRRKIITELLGIPPMLFGLAILEDGTLVEGASQEKPVFGGQTVLKRTGTDIEVYEANLRTRWRLHAVSDAGDAIPAIRADIQQLEQLTNDAKGDFLARVQELLFSNYYLASIIVGHKGRFRESHSYVNNAVRVAKALEDTDLVATALCSRGSKLLGDGLVGRCDEKGIFVVNRALLEEAVRAFEEAKKNAHPQLKGKVMLELGRAQAHLDMNYDPLDTLKKAARLIGKDRIDDPYIRQLITGTYSGFHEGAYLTGSAVILNALGDPIEALSNIESLKKLNENNTYRKEQHHTFAWIDIITAESHLRMHNYDQATKLALQALKVCLELHKIPDILAIRDLHGRLLGTPYGNSIQVKDLGEMLKKGKALWCQ